MRSIYEMHWRELLINICDYDANTAAKVVADLEYLFEDDFVFHELPSYYIVHHIMKCFFGQILYDKCDCYEVLRMLNTEPSTSTDVALIRERHMLFKNQITEYVREKLKYGHSTF